MSERTMARIKASVRRLSYEECNELHSWLGKHMSRLYDRMAREAHDRAWEEMRHLEPGDLVFNNAERVVLSRHGSRWMKGDCAVVVKVPRRRHRAVWVESEKGFLSISTHDWLINKMTTHPTGTEPADVLDRDVATALESAMRKVETAAEQALAQVQAEEERHEGF